MAIGGLAELRAHVEGRPYELPTHLGPDRLGPERADSHNEYQCKRAVHYLNDPASQRVWWGHYAEDELVHGHGEREQGPSGQYGPARHAGVLAAYTVAREAGHAEVEVGLRRWLDDEAAMVAQFCRTRHAGRGAYRGPRLTVPHGRFGSQAADDMFLASGYYGELLGLARTKPPARLGQFDEWTILRHFNRGGWDTDPARLRGVRLFAPLVVIEYDHGGYAAYMERNPNPNTGPMMAVVVHGDGSHEELLLDVGRARSKWGEGWCEERDGYLVAEVPWKGAWQRGGIELPMGQEIGRWGTGPKGFWGDLPPRRVPPVPVIEPGGVAPRPPPPQEDDPMPDPAPWKLRGLSPDDLKQGPHPVDPGKALRIANAGIRELKAGDHETAVNNWLTAVNELKGWRP